MEISMITSEAEHAVLAACMTDPESIRFASRIVEPADFWNPQASLLFQVITDLHQAGKPNSAVAVANECARQGLKIGFSDIGSLLGGAENAGSVAYHAEIVRNESARRRITEVLTRAQQAVNEHQADVSEIIQGVIHGAREVSSGIGGESFTAKPLGDIMAIKDTFEWVIPGLLEKRDRVIVTAGEGAGKTTLIRQMAIASATGIHPFQLTPIRPVRVLVIDSENSERQWRRASGRLLNAAQQSNGQGDPLTNVRIACIPRTSITRDRELGKIHRMIDDFQPEIVCIGPLYRLAPGSMNSDEDVAPVLAALDTIRDTGAAMIIEGHAGKGANAAGARDLRPRGSSALLGWPEFGFGLAHSDQEGVLDLQRWRGDREERSWPESLARTNPWYFRDNTADGLARWGQRG